MSEHVKYPSSLSMVLPGYNEEANIEATVRRGLEALARFSDQYEIVIVDDGSTDAMPAIADQLAQETRRVRVIHNPINLGVGISFLIGMAAARGDLIIHNAMDYPFHLEDLGQVLPLFPDFDLVVIERHDRTAHSPWRKLTSWVNNELIRLLFLVNFRDMNFVQMYKRDVLRTIRVKAKSPAFVTPELIIRAHRHGYRIGRIGATFHRREKGNACYGKIRDILWTLADMLSFRLERDVATPNDDESPLSTRPGSGDPHDG